VLELISMYGFGPVIVILLVGIPAVFGMIGWCKKLWGIREKFKKDNMQAGARAYQEEEAEEQRFSSGETRIA
jgi:hypothetical protein